MPIIERCLSGLCEWVEHENLKVAEKQAKSENLNLLEGQEVLRNFIRNAKIVTKREQIIKRVDEAIHKLDLPNVDPSKVSSELRLLLEADSTFIQHTQ